MNLVPYLDNMFDPSIPLKGYESKEDKFKDTAVFLSHVHLDHSKIINYLNPSVPLYMLEGTKSLLNTLNINNDFLFPLHNQGESNVREINGVKENEVVQVGNIVKVLDIEFDETVEYTIVGSTEVDLSQNKISNESPIGKALMGRKKKEERRKRKLLKNT